MARRNGRGLAALLPDASAVEADTDTRGPVGLLSDELTAELAEQESGLALIYAVLDALVDNFGLDDAAVIIEEPGLGRQVFRAGRRPLGDSDEALLTADPGLYTKPALEDGELDRSLVLALFVLALRLDVVRYDAWRDPLTALYDRRSFDRLLEISVARSKRYGWPFTLVIVDLDRLKEINDREGHTAGDAALRDLGERFRRGLRFGDNAARIGGDEFAMILPGADADLVPNLLERVRTADGTGLRHEAPSFSFGAATCPDEADAVETLFRLADERLLTAKQHRTEP